MLQIGIVHDLATCLNNDGHIDALFLDLAITFDKVPHQHLCSKLSHYRINSNILTWIKDFLNNIGIKQCYTRRRIQHTLI